MAQDSIVLHPNPWYTFRTVVLSHILDDLPTVHTHVVVNPNDIAIFKAQFPAVNFVMQKTALGTGDAVKAALAELYMYESTIAICADMPLIPKKLIQELLLLPPANRVVGFKPKELSQYGIIENNGKKATKIIEPPFHHQTNSQIANSGIIEITKDTLPHVNHIKPCPASKEFYLTQLIQPKHQFDLIEYDGDPSLLTGINTPSQLANLERTHLNNLQEQLSMCAQVDQIRTIYLQKMPKIGKNVKIGCNVHLYGNVEIGDHSIIETGSIITESHIGKGVHLKPYTIINHSKISNSVTLGPLVISNNSLRLNKTQ